MRERGGCGLEGMCDILLSQSWRVVNSVGGHIPSSQRAFCAKKWVIWFISTLRSNHPNLEVQRTGFFFANQVQPC